MKSTHGHPGTPSGCREQGLAVRVSVVSPCALGVTPRPELALLFFKVACGLLCVEDNMCCLCGGFEECQVCIIRSI